ncbi:MAG: hypothetical protein ABI298_06875 [Acidimicrobiales bacterium]
MTNVATEGRVELLRESFAYGDRRIDNNFQGSGLMRRTCTHGVEPLLSERSLDFEARSQNRRHHTFDGTGRLARCR